MDFKELLNSREFIFLDGAMGTMLQSMGLEAGELPEKLSIENPSLLQGIHASYAKAGADIVYANTFGANRIKAENSGYTVSEMVSAAVENARIGANGALVALDIGPTGKLLEPTGSLSFEEAYDIFKEQVQAGVGADIIVIETMTDLYEMRAALLAAKENSDKPVICTMTFEQNMRTFTGCSVAAMALTLEGLGADAIGINCSLGPRELYPIVRELSRWTTLPIAVKPNAGLPDPETNEYSITADEFASLMRELVPFGVKLVGGCCGTTPEFIAALRRELHGVKYSPAEPEIPSAVCSYSSPVVIDSPRIIGERINPTGKKRFKEALKNGDIGYILSQAIEQTEAGAEILDVNVGLPDIDEKDMMVRSVKAIQGVTDAPLQIDSTSPEVIEAALRAYNGKAIVNSVNGDEESLLTILPIVKKYGAAVVGLTLDSNGIPPTAEGRFAIAERILSRAEAIGIPRRDVFIDCLTLTVSTEQSGAATTLEALSMVRKRLGLNTVLGVSNISFGLPSREFVNCAFLTMAMQKGLTLPIINPNIAAMTGAVRAYRVLSSADMNSSEYIAAYGGAEPKKSAEPMSDMTLAYAVEHGLKEEGARITERLLETTDSMDIVDNILIPALDKTGADFESGRIFLPQLILSAGVAQAAFEVIRNKLLSSGGSPVSKGKIVLATVKGDIHDIGKNIVKVLLENYGYTVIDLGRDVDYQRVVDAVREHNCRLVGLSALMTTTLSSMEQTIRLLRENNLDCKVMVGGAVLTPEYADKIGADFYSRDAKQSVDIARQVFGE